MGAANDVSFFRRADANVSPSNRVKTPSIDITELPTSPIEDTETTKTTPKSTLVLSPSLVTQDFDQLCFEAAALNQLSISHQHTSTDLPSSGSDSNSEDHSSKPSTPSKYSSLLISSPYNIPGHYLDLSTLSPTSLLFAKALTALKPVRPDYATAPYTESLNFPAVLESLRDLAATDGISWPATSFYVVVFRSKLNPSIDKDWLYNLDCESHREACESGGLLKYWFGKTNDENRNLATCFWQSRADAYQGGLGPWHKKARAAGRELYEKIVFTTHRFTVLDGAEEFRFENWRDADGVA